jgi:serine/threonine protein kinase
VAGNRNFLGPFRTVRLIRAGQTCQVWEAVDERTKERVALKALQPEKRNDKTEIAYLKHEYVVANKFDHENIIRIDGFYTDRSVPFLAMEFNSGKNAKIQIRQNFEEILYFSKTIIETAAQGMSYLNHNGWLHCDIKPDNLLIAENGVTKVIDFAISQKIRKGISKFLGSRSKQTQGTRSYMSPEQIRGQRLSEESDIYSFGCTVFEILTKKPPFSASTPDELLMKHLRSSAPVASTINSNITAELSELIRAMMSKKKEKRPSSFDEFLNLFRAIRPFRIAPKLPSQEEDEK